MKKLAVFFICIFVFTTIGFSQTEMGPEAQRAFGKGANDYMIGGRYETFHGKNSWSIGLTYNFSSHKSYSEHKGIGFYIGYRHGFNYNNSGNGNAFFGFRGTFLFNNFSGKERLNSTSVMPTCEAGYQVLFGNNFYTTPAIGYGYSIKLSKDYNSLQEDDGGRFIPGISMGYRF
ncbi:MAG TPA: hypothetical protein VG676_15400 [Chitinophagaceae bacterium]|jgi:hypothetical protein|nr:hypothetical protein [Chitinophagaceae bacterium]